MLYTTSQCTHTMHSHSDMQFLSQDLNAHTSNIYVYTQLSMHMVIHINQPHIYTVSMHTSNRCKVLRGPQHAYIMHTHQTFMYIHGFQTAMYSHSVRARIRQVPCAQSLTTRLHHAHTSKRLVHASLNRCHVHTASRQAFIMHTHPKRMCACLSMPTHQAFPSRRLSGRELPHLATHTHHTATCTRPNQQQTSAHCCHLVQTRTEQHCVDQNSIA